MPREKGGEGMSEAKATSRDELRGELIEDMWALWHNGTECSECPKRMYDECVRMESLSCSAVIMRRAAAVGIELEW